MKAVHHVAVEIAKTKSLGPQRAQRAVAIKRWPGRNCASSSKPFALIVRGGPVVWLRVQPFAVAIDKTKIKTSSLVTRYTDIKRVDPTIAQRVDAVTIRDQIHLTGTLDLIQRMHRVARGGAGKHRVRAVGPEEGRTVV